jgi:NTP pyrophosphatase (non-canonical NTP hydrolase)
MDLQELQNYAVQLRTERGFTRDSLRMLTLLMEEVGEVARELKRTWSPNYGEFSRDRLAEELADVQILLLALAAEHEIDLESVCLAKWTEDGKRRWKSADGKHSA